jgi:hypothetical protein
MRVRQKRANYFNRAARPPRLLVIWPARVGSSAITVARASTDMRDHAPISSIDLRQPVQSLLSGWITQILMQGLSISARDQM